MSRTSSAHLQKQGSDGIATLHQVGANWTRREWIRDPDTGLVLPAVRLEPERTNKALQSRAAGTTWTAAALTGTDDDASAGLTGEDYMDGLIGTAVDTDHGITQAITLTAAPWAISVVATVGNKTWLYLADETLAAGGAYFDVANVAKGASPGGNVNSTLVSDLGGGRVRCEIRVTGTAAAHTIGVYAAHADGDTDFTGDASTSNIYVGDMQVEAGDYASSVIATTTAAATRTADSQLIYDLSSELAGKRVSLAIPILLPEHTPSANTELIKIYDSAGAGTDYLLLSAAATTGSLLVTSACSGGDAGSCTVARDICDGRIHWLHCSWQPGCLQAWVDGVAGTPDLAVDVPGGLDRVAYQASGGLCGGIEIQPSFQRHPWRPLALQLQ